MWLGHYAYGSLGTISRIKIMENKSITITKVVSRNFFLDIVARWQNTFGMNLTSYEKMIDKAMNQIKKDIGDKELEWYRYEITQLTSGAVSITLYGDLK